MKLPPRYGLVIVWSLLFSLLFNSAFYLWFRTNSLTTFLVSEIVHSLDQKINDNLPYNWAVRHDKEINATFDHLIDETDFGSLAGFAFFNWQYRDDMRFWDVADLPVIAFTYLTGDCDDYARMIAYVEHRKGYETYFVSMVSGSSGHAASVYYDAEKKTLNLVDINMIITRDVPEFDMERDIGRLVHIGYPDMVHFGVRTWDLKKLLLYAEIRRVD